MQVQKKVITYEDWNIDIIGATILSVEEVKKVPEKNRKCGQWWWVQNPGGMPNGMMVDAFGNLRRDNGQPLTVVCGVRPALKFNHKSPKLRIGDVVKVFNRHWTIISGKYLLCNKVVGYTTFESSWTPKKANIEYENTDIKKWLEDWYSEQLKAQKEG